MKNVKLREMQIPDRKGRSGKSNNGTGRWIEQDGHHICLPSGKNLICIQILRKHGLRGIEYIGNDPDFSPVAEASLMIPAMSGERNQNKGDINGYGTGDFPTKLLHDPASEQLLGKLLSDPDLLVSNYTQADMLLAAKWNQENRDERSNWSAKDVEKYRTDNALTWHERSDGSMMDLIPTCINSDFSHTGGVGMYNDSHKIDTESDDPYFDEDEEDRNAQKPVRQRGFSILQIVIFVAMVAGHVLTYCLSNGPGLWKTITWILVSAAPYITLLTLCVKKGGLPKFLRNKYAGIALLVLWAVIMILTPMLMMGLFFAFVVIFALTVLRAGGSIHDAMPQKPKGTIKIETTDEKGHYYVEHREVEGNIDTEVNRIVDESERAGYDVTRRN